MNQISSSTPKPELISSAGLEATLKRLKLVDAEQIEQARKLAGNTKLLSSLAKQEFIDESHVIDLLAKDLGLSTLKQLGPEALVGSSYSDLLHKVETNFLYLHRCFPLEDRGEQAVVVFCDPLDIQAMQALEFVLEKRIIVALASEREVLTFITKAASNQNLVDAVDSLSIASPSTPFSALELQVTATEEGSSESMKAGSESAPVVRLVNKLLADGLAQNASDIHLEPTTGSLEVRFRVDGVMSPHLTIPKRLQPYTLTRIKLLSGMNITERRRPQDGRFRIRAGATETADIRASSVPSAHGESLVLRILRANADNLQLAKLGLDAETQARFEEVLTLRDRMVIVTGPTGSGKSTSLYSALYHVKQGSTNIITVEDPVEYRIEGITQIQVDTKVGMTFASGLRSVLRQDPDIILVGEIRDLETAQVAFQAAQTGHLVLSTLHTNSAAAAVVRLVDLGLEPFVIAPSLGAVMSQRLVRTLCESCKEPLQKEKAEELAKEEGLSPETLFEAKGCEECSLSGYLGRKGVYSLIVVDHEIRELIRNEASETEIEEAAYAKGTRSMYESGLSLVSKGLTTIEEIQRVLGKASRRSPAAKAPAASNETDNTGLSLEESAPVIEEEPAKKATILEIDTVEDLANSFIEGADEAVEEFDFEAAIEAAEEAATKGGSIADLAASYKITETLLKPANKLLLVDDDIGIRAVMSRALGKAGFDVTEAKDGIDALEKLEECFPNIVVSDLMMPRLDGEGFVKKFRELPDTKEIPILMLTGSDTEDNEIRLIEAGANDFVSKGSSPAVVIARIKRLLG